MNFDQALMKYKVLTALRYVKSPLLDVGCGDGQFIHHLKTILPDIECWGIDSNREKIIWARNHINGVFYWLNFEETDYSDKWATLTAFNILEHVDDHGLFLDACNRSLMRDGKLIISVPNGAAFHKRLGVEMGISEPYQLTDDDIKKGHKHTYNLPFLRAIMKRSGFKIVASKGIFFKPLPSDMLMQHYSRELFDGLYEMGKLFPDWCSSIMVVGEKR